MRYLLLALALVACNEDTKPARKRARPAAVEEEAEPKAAAAPVSDDPSWISGTWQKKGAREWLLFNPPAQVAVIAGKPPAMIARGEFVPSGRSISLFFRGTGGTQERVLEAAPDRSELHEVGPTPATYRRGAPP